VIGEEGDRRWKGPMKKRKRGMGEDKDKKVGGEWKGK